MHLSWILLDITGYYWILHPSLPKATQLEARLTKKGNN